MKKTFYSIILLVGITTLAFGQSQRLVLLEHFTQASCGPCATYNPQINNLLLNNPDKFTAVMYHTSWPGYDPMYNHNPSEVGSRVSYYSVNSVPNSVIDGNVYNGHPNGWNISTINNRYAVPSPFNIAVQQELTSNDEVFKVTVMIEATQAVESGMKAQIAVIEKHIHFSSPPGSNGETDFYHVMKKMLPSQGGTTLPAFEAGEYMILQYTWEHQNVYDLSELAAVVFIQNNNTKEVLQAANSSTDPFAPLFSTDVEVVDLHNLSLFNCDGKISPIIEIRNNGSSVLTQADITVTMNGEELTNFQWTGNLGFLESEFVATPEFTFSVQDENMLEVSIDNPNGTSDEYPLNNIYDLEIDRALLGQTPMTLLLTLDDNPEETTWEIKNYEGTIIHQGGPYSTPGQTIIESLEFTNTNCYTFTINDSGGDGLSQGGNVVFGFGSTALLNEINFGSQAETQFRIEFTDVDNYTSGEVYNIFPNPATDRTTINIPLSGNTNVSYALYSMTGKSVMEEDLGFFNAGNQYIDIDMSGVDAGIYYLSLNVGEETYTEKIVITR